MRILIYGAGVIGSLYALLFIKGGYDVTVLARNQRLKQLKNGLKYINHNTLQSIDVRTIEYLEPDDRYDFVFVCVRGNQIEEVLHALSQNASPVIVTMTNSLQPYAEWEEIVGKGRILPAFPGAGGGIKDGILHASLTPSFIQKTTFGEIDGRIKTRTKDLAELFHKCSIPYEITKDMHAWQLSHLALVVPLADAYRKTNDPRHVGQNSCIMKQTAAQIKENMRILHQMNQLTPSRFKILIYCPLSIMTTVLGTIYQSSFGNIFMYQHARKAPDEMIYLHTVYYNYIDTTASCLNTMNRKKLPAVKK